MSFILWFTGLSGAGKSTLARALLPELSRYGLDKVEVLDGDEVREHISKGLGFSREDRRTNVLRIGYVARLLARNQAVAITAAISPYASDRDEVRAKSEAPFVEVHVDAWLSFNGRPARRWIDPSVDLAAAPRSPWHKRWILPATPSSADR